MDVAVTLSIGERSYQEYKDLFLAGTDRFLLRFETSDESYTRIFILGKTLATGFIV